MEEIAPRVNTVTIELEEYAHLINNQHLLDAKEENLSRWKDYARTVDAWRIFPRLFIGTYIYLFYESTMWFMKLEEPNTSQAGLISVIVGAGAVWFGHYVNSGKKE